jgi:S-adenosylmethionine:tRNA ribosyltransferase-isomerase
MKLEEFNYHLPQDLIAQRPLKDRDNSKLMVLNRCSLTIEHTYFYELPRYFTEGDVLVANDTRVIPARIYGQKKTGGWVELFLLRFLENGEAGSQIWECLLHSRRKPRMRSMLYFGGDFQGEVLEALGGGKWRVRLNYTGSFDEALHKIGRTPLPHYISRDKDLGDEVLDRERYQTVYAAKDGAVAAPTAGLHFSPSLINEIKGHGVEFLLLTLHVGLGTFSPIREENIEDHSMHAEFFQLPIKTAARLNQARQQGKKIISIGTTTTRTIETMTKDNGVVYPGQGFTDLFVYPGYSFKAVGAMITNFHLPQSSLMLLVCAFAGQDFIQRAYQEAIARQYRFYSYGDAMLIL